MIAQLLRIATTLIPLVGVVACSNSPPPSPVPRPRTSTAPARAVVLLRNDWRATVTMLRSDSLVLTLPNGSQQLQRVGRSARFTVEVGSNNAFIATLDSLALQPPSGAMAEAIGTRWTGRVSGAGRIEGLRISRPSGLGDDLTATVRSLIPLVPFTGMPVGRSWKDTTSGSVQVEVFRANEQRVRTWTAGERTDRNGIPVYPVRVHEEFEQLGRGSQGGREMTMTAQGSRTGNYYMTLDGRVDGAVFQDSIAQFITIPAAKQTVPTMRYSRTTLRFATSPRGDRP